MSSHLSRDWGPRGPHLLQSAVCYDLCLTVRPGPGSGFLLWSRSLCDLISGQLSTGGSGGSTDHLPVPTGHVTCGLAPEGHLEMWRRQLTAQHCNTLHCNTLLQHTAIHCNTLQHTATQCFNRLLQHSGPVQTCINMHPGWSDHKCTVHTCIRMRLSLFITILISMYAEKAKKTQLTLHLINPHFFSLREFDVNKVLVFKQLFGSVWYQNKNHVGTRTFLNLNTQRKHWIQNRVLKLSLWSVICPSAWRLKEDIMFQSTQQTWVLIGRNTTSSLTFREDINKLLSDINWLMEKFQQEQKTLRGQSESLNECRQKEARGDHITDMSDKGCKKKQSPPPHSPVDSPIQTSDLKLLLLLLVDSFSRVETDVATWSHDLLSLWTCVG